MHDAKTDVVIGSRSGIARLDVKVHLGPAKAQHPPQHPHEPVFHIRVRQLGDAVSVDDDQRMQKISCNSEMVDSSVDGVAEALGGIACALAKKRVGDGAVRVVNDTHRRARGRRHNVSGHGDGSIAVAVDVRAVDIFRKLTSVRD